jgi:DNA repair photolyase
MIQTVGIDIKGGTDHTDEEIDINNYYIYYPCDDCTILCGHIGSLGESEICPVSVGNDDDYYNSICSQPQKATQKYGTRELSETSINSLIGCSNNCIFCYAAHNAVEKEFVSSRAAWAFEKARRSQPDLSTKYSGRVMYPTSHDITPKYLPMHINVVRSLLEAGNELLICSKARLGCIKEIAKVCAIHKAKVVFMITVTTLDETQSIFWEPNAPLPAERILTLEYLHREGFKTSVLVEPLLQGPGSAIDIYNRVIEHVSDEIWFGTMNHVDTRVDASNPENAKAVALIKRYHSKENMRFLYDTMVDMPKVRFKRSIVALNEKK